MKDEGHIQTNKILSDVEDEVEKVYRQAAEETQKKLDNYLQRFSTKDKIKRDLLEAGKITQKEYNDWRLGQIMIGQRWEEMRDSLAQDLHNSNMIARNVVKGHTPEVYAVNHNYATFQIEKASLVNTSYTLYDRQTVERIMRDSPKMLPTPGERMKQRIASGKDVAWQRGQIQSVMVQAILQGESIPQISKRIATTMSSRNDAATTRYARTAITGAQNAGRIDAYERAEEMGIELEQEWLATLDNRTRHSHALMDGESVPVGEKFSNGCKFPGDPDGPPEEIWNCRCTLVPHLKSIDQSLAPRHDEKLGGMSYDEWKYEHEKQRGYERKIVNGKDLVGIWEWNPDQFEFAIDDIVHRQGFDGLPRVVSESEFNEIYTGEQPMLLRTFSAPDEEALKAYDNELKNGKFYVDCSNGGANYGQGMYTAGVYGEKGSKKAIDAYNGAMEEMAHYSSIKGRDTMVSMTETMTLDPSARVIKLSDLRKDPDFKSFSKGITKNVDIARYAEQVRSVTDTVSQAKYIPESEKTAMLNTLSKLSSKIDSGKLSGVHDSLYDIVAAGSKFETGVEYSMFGEGRKATQLGKAFTDISDKYGAYKSGAVAPEGIFAASRGYDAINAYGHGSSGSYTVVLNRTKLIIREGKND